MREGNDLLVQVQDIIVSRGNKYLHMEGQHIHIAMRGDKDFPMELQHLIYFKEGGLWRNKSFECLFKTTQA